MKSLPLWLYISWKERPIPIFVKVPHMRSEKLNCFNCMKLHWPGRSVYFAAKREVSLKYARSRNGWGSPCLPGYAQRIAGVANTPMRGYGRSVVSRPLFNGGQESFVCEIAIWCYVFRESAYAAVRFDPIQNSLSGRLRPPHRSAFAPRVNNGWVICPSLCLGGVFLTGPMYKHIRQDCSGVPSYREPYITTLAHISGVQIYRFPTDRYRWGVFRSAKLREREMPRGDKI